MSNDQIAIIRTILMLISTLTIVVGWYTINRQNNQRETRKEVRKLLDDICNDLEKLTRDAVQFHTNERDPVSAMTIQTRIQLTIDKINRSAEVLNLDTEMLMPCFDLRRAITLKNFDPSSHQVCNSDDDLIVGIIGQHPSLISPLEDAFYKKYAY